MTDRHRYTDRRRDTRERSDGKEQEEERGKENRTRRISERLLQRKLLDGVFASGKWLLVNRRTVAHSAVETVKSM